MTSRWRQVEELYDAALDLAAAERAALLDRADSELRREVARAGPSHNYHVELLYQRRTRRARSVFQRLALPTPVSISNGICSG
jgi:hypothetical protein